MSVLSAGSMVIVITKGGITTIGTGSSAESVAALGALKVAADDGAMFIVQGAGIAGMPAVLEASNNAREVLGIAAAGLAASNQSDRLRMLFAFAVGTIAGAAVVAGVSGLAAVAAGIIVGELAGEGAELVYDAAKWLIENRHMYGDVVTEWDENGNTLIMSPYDSWIDSARVIDATLEKFEKAKTIVSPIVLDLNGDGIAATSWSAGGKFDHDANRFAERTGWINGQDGLLALDRDANGVIDSGRELFGSETLLAGGGKALDGYQALAELDSNADGQINAQDSAFANLRIWKDADGDGLSSADELLTPAAAGVQSIATASVATDQVDAHGNVVKQTGTFTRTDGSTGQSADIWFAVNTTLTTALDWLPETPEIAALPDLKGYGNVHSLHQTMLRDGSGRLQSLVQQFAAAADVPARRALLDQILYAWTGVENIAPESRGFMPDARQLHVLEALLGEDFIQGYGYNAGTPNAGPNAAEYLTGIYLELADGIYGQLMAQTHLKPLFDSISITWDAANNQLQWDVSDTVSVLEDLSTAGRSDAIRDFIGALSQRGESGAQIFEALRAQGTVAGDFTNWVMTFGSGGATIASTSTVGDAGNNTLVGTAASDLLLGKQGDDVLDGGAGNDLLQGDQGNDTYLFGLGGGQDALLDLEGAAMQNALVGAYLNDMASSFREQAAAVTA